MFTDHPFLAVRQVYVVLMAVAVVVGTLADVYHKRSGEFFAADRQRKRAAAKRPLGGGELAALAVHHIVS